MGEKEITCREVLDLLTEYLDGVLPAPVEHRVAQHLDECPGCARYLDQLRSTVAATGRLRDEDVPEAVRRQLLDAFRRWNSPG